MRQAFTDAEIEASSGKGAGEENFPVGSFLIERPLRPHVKAYYDFARAADDIGDAEHLPPEEKIRRLDAFALVLEGKADGLTRPAALRASLRQRNIPLERGGDLLAAFRQDAVKKRYETLEELLDYCRCSANPVGRFLLDLHGEDRALFAASDALCTSLQILNHLQDAGDDLERMDRCYLPEAWLREEGASVEDLRAGRSGQGLRTVMLRLLVVCTEHNARAADLIGGLKNRRLAAESAVILNLARRLTEKLMKTDPVAQRVALTKGDFARAGVFGVMQSAFPGKRPA